MKQLLLALGAAAIVAVGIAVGGLLGAFGDGDARDALAAASPPGGAIGVHGQWTIDVLDADGALVSRREFHNDLANLGGGYLAGILARSGSPGQWFVITEGSDIATSSPCLSDDTVPPQPRPCRISEPGDPFPASSTITKSLEISTSADKLFLEGTLVVGRDGDIGAVATHNVQCAYGAAPPCTGYQPAFTSTAISPPISVLAGQQVLVHVEINFSAAP